MATLGATSVATSVATSTDLSNHEADTTVIHGIANTANLYVAGGTDVAVADGGTGASTAAAARNNLVADSQLFQRTGGTFFYSHRPANAATQTTINGTLYAIPFYVPVTKTFDGISVAVVGTASSAARLGIYSDTNGVPDTLILDAGSVGTTTNGTKTIAISQSLTGGQMYWLACAAQGANGSYVGTSATWLSGDQIPTTAPFSGNNNAYSQTGVSGALPSPWGATLTPTGLAVSVYLKAA